MRRFYMTLEEKRAILKSFNELVEVKDEKNGYSYFLDDNHNFKLIAKDFSDSGTGYVADNEGWINVKDFSARDFRDLLHKTVDSKLT